MCREGGEEGVGEVEDLEVVGHGFHPADLLVDQAVTDHLARTPLVAHLVHTHLVGHQVDVHLAGDQQVLGQVHLNQPIIHLLAELGLLLRLVNSKFTDQ